MIQSIKSQEEILQKLGITELNAMQVAANEAILEHPELVVLSPTGSGKTLAFALPLISLLDAAVSELQALIVVPTRELALQIEQVIREMGSGYKINAVYGGRAGAKDKIELLHTPAILIGTPGRIADHVRRENVDLNNVKTLVLDEFDKSLEIGFEGEMREILEALRSDTKKVLTSATEMNTIPSFVGLKSPVIINFLSEQKPEIKIVTVAVENNAPLETVHKILGHVGDASGIVFCNLKDSLEQVSDYLYDRNIGHACFYGGLEQIDRERALMKFRNGSCKILLATDLAARGIDVNELDYILHYELPNRKEEFIHRNGRTARMHSKGTAFVLKHKNRSLPDFVKSTEILAITEQKDIVNSQWDTLFVSGGRKDKISKGDIAGLFFKQGKLEKHELGAIELKIDCAFVSVPVSKSAALIETLNNVHLKKRKLRVNLVE